jgi:hypothetical protein
VGSFLLAVKRRPRRSRPRQVALRPRPRRKCSIAASSAVQSINSSPADAWTEFAVDSLLDQIGFEPLVSVATEMLIELARGITNATRDACDRRHRANAAVALTRKWDQRFESAFLQRGVNKFSVLWAYPPCTYSEASSVADWRAQFESASLQWPVDNKPDFVLYCRGRWGC